MSKHQRFWFGLVPILLLASPGLLAAQGTSADYDRANHLDQLIRDTTFRMQVAPHWTANGDGCFYRINDPNGVRNWIWVDALAGTRQPAFDNVKLASALSPAIGRKLDPDRLPIDLIEQGDTPATRIIHVQGKRWQVDRGTYTITALNALAQNPTSPPMLTRIHPSKNGGEETSINFENRTSEIVALFWIDPEGTAVSYGTIAPGQQSERSTYAGHVWAARSKDGTLLGIFEAIEGGSDATIEPRTTSGRVLHSPAPATGPDDDSDSTASDEGESHPGRAHQSPDGNYSAYIEKYNVYLRDRPANRNFALTTDGELGDSYDADFHWSFDSKKLVVVKTLDGDHRKVYLVQSSPPDQLQPKLLEYDYPKPGDKIPLRKPHLFDLPSKKEIAISDSLFPNPWSLDDIRWDADSSRFTFLYNQRGHQVLRIVAVNASSGKASAIIDEQSKTFIDYSGKMFVHYLPATREIIWMSERDGWNHLYLYDSGSRQVKNQITRGSWAVRKVDEVDAEKRQIWFEAGGIYPDQDPYYIHFCRVNFDGTGLTVLTQGDGTHKISYSPDKRFFTDSYSRIDQPPTVELRRSSDGRLVCELEKANIEPLIATGWKLPEHFVAKGRDGTTDIYGVIYRPMNLDPKKKYPILEDIYAGPQDSFVPKSFERITGGMKMAQLGFIVVQIDGMGTSNRSKAFHDVCWRNLGDSGFPDRILWMKSAAAKYPYIDLTRVGIYGTSAGGQSALRAVESFGDFYSAAVADCGCHDNRMDKIWWNEQWMGWPIGPWYQEQSNVTNAKNLHGALLLIVDELDHNVDPASTMQVVNALIKADKDFDLLVIPNADHGQDGDYGNRRRQDFFVRHLLHVEPRAS
jgi:dipeptidyl aminopeptidase/acylaminoacyl peptidase